MIRRLSVLGVLIATGILSANVRARSNVIENPAKPLAANADRKVELKEVLRITDEGGQFYFKYPYQIRVSPNESIFVVEQEQLLQFDKTGAYVRNYFKKGQGPGEVQFVSGFKPLEKGLYVHGAPGKLIFFDPKGAFVQETTVRGAVPHVPTGRYCGRTFYFYRQRIPLQRHQRIGADGRFDPSVCADVEGGPGAIGKAGRVRPRVLRHTFRRRGRDHVFDRLCHHPDRLGRLVISHTQDYLLKIFDIGSGSVTKSFRRPYERIRYEPPKNPQGGMTINGKQVSWPTRKYVSDLVNIFRVGSQIWAVTSTQDKDQNPLVDVYDFEGRYLDRFFLARPAGAKRLGLGLGNSVIQGRNIYLIERDEEEGSAIVKYEIIDPGVPVR